MDTHTAHPHLVEEVDERAVGLTKHSGEQHGVLDGGGPRASLEEEAQPIADEPDGRELEEVPAVDVKGGV